MYYQVSWRLLLKVWGASRKGLTSWSGLLQSSQPGTSGLPRATSTHQQQVIPTVYLTSTVPYNTIPYHTILYQYRTVPYRTVPYRTVPYRAVPYRTVPYRTVLYHTVPYRTIPYHTVPYPYSNVPCHAIAYHSIAKHSVPYRAIQDHTLPFRRWKAHKCGYTNMLRLNFLFPIQPSWPCGPVLNCLHLSSWSSGRKVSTEIWNILVNIACTLNTNSHACLGIG